MSEKQKERKEYVIHKDLIINSVKHCASLAIVPPLMEIGGQVSLPSPSTNLINGTITFIKFENRIYGITCQHVVDIYRRQKQQDSGYTLRTMINGFYVIIDRFEMVQDEVYGRGGLDIAIRLLDEAFIIKIGKTYIDIDNAIEPPDGIRHAIAVGFPTNLKKRKEDKPPFHRIAMPHAEIVAEIKGKPSDRFSLFSEVPEALLVSDYSGMSGGPIYWSTEGHYGILGIVYESNTGGELFGDKVLHVSGELATPGIIKAWIRQYRAKQK